MNFKNFLHESFSDIKGMLDDAFQHPWDFSIVEIMADYFNDHNDSELADLIREVAVEVKQKEPRWYITKKIGDESPVTKLRIKIATGVVIHNIGDISWSGYNKKIKERDIKPIVYYILDNWLDTLEDKAHGQHDKTNQVHRMLFSFLQNWVDRFSQMQVSFNYIPDTRQNTERMVSRIKNIQSNLTAFDKDWKIISPQLNVLPQKQNMIESLIRAMTILLDDINSRDIGYENEHGITYVDTSKIQRQLRATIRMLTK